MSCVACTKRSESGSYHGIEQWIGYYTVLAGILHTGKDSLCNQGLVRRQVVGLVKAAIC